MGGGPIGTAVPVVIPRSTPRAIALWFRVRPWRRPECPPLPAGMCGWPCPIPVEEQYARELESGQWRRDLTALRDALRWWNAAREGATIPKKHDQALEPVTVEHGGYVTDPDYTYSLTALGERLSKKV